MNARRAWLIAACLFGLAAGPATAQSPWPAQQQQPQQEQPATLPWPGQPQKQAPAPAQSPWTQQVPAQQEVCIETFGKLRDDAQKKAEAIRNASSHKATAQEACGLFNAFSAAEAKMLKYSVDNAASCGIPPQVAQSLKQQHAKTSEMRARVCQAAAAPARPAAPSLSDALSAPVPNSNNIKTGRGTYDTLTGTPLGSK